MIILHDQGKAEGLASSMAANAQRLGFVGLGNMGARMALRLIHADHGLVIYDVNPQTVSELARAGAEVANSPSDVGSRAAIVFCSLPTPAIVQKVILGEDGIVYGDQIKTIVDLSTTGSQTAAFISQLHARGVEFIDSPVSGGTSGAAAGTLMIMLSGRGAAVEAVGQFLKLLGDKIYYLGETPGSAQSLKLANNMLCAAITVASFEALLMGVKAGLDPKLMLEVINASSGRDFATAVKIPECILNRSFPVRFSTELLHKDVKLGLEEAESLGVPMWVIPMARQYLAFARTQGDGPIDYAHTSNVSRNGPAYSLVPRNAPKIDELMSLDRDIRSLIARPGAVFGTTSTFASLIAFAVVDASSKLASAAVTMHRGDKVANSFEQTGA